MTPSPRRGMTLIELIMALTIGSMVIGAVLAVLKSANDTQTLGERRADLLQCVRVSLNQMHRDLQLTVTRSNDEQFMFIGTNEGEEGLPTDSIEFTSASGDPMSSLLPTGDLLRMQYYLDLDEETEPTGLVRSALRLPLPEEISPTEAELSARTYCPWAVGLNFEYYDPTQQDWVEEWQERTDVPTAVRISLYVLPEPLDKDVEPTPDDVIPFSTVVQLPLAGTTLGTGQPSTGQSGGAANVPGAGGLPGGAGASPTIPGLPGGLPGLPTPGGAGQP
ncbi:MAG: prepilin-type N-terminal cleavage/methylation domain-containing protein [Armatimonadetes bacterium]|nr:prepilin-type N-terminal cleavage/methylation domain-containing protein [Armatimonadota bacterium]